MVEFIIGKQEDLECCVCKKSLEESDGLTTHKHKSKSYTSCGECEYKAIRLYKILRVEFR